MVYVNRIRTPPAYNPRMRLEPLEILLGAAVALSACAPPPTAAPPELQPLEAPAGAGAGEPHLGRLPDGRALLSWVEPSEKGHALRFATRPPGGAWSEPVTAAEGADWFVNWADFPSVNASPDGSLFAHWLRRSGAGTYAYDVWVSISRDGGASWDAPRILHGDGTRSEHGFVSMVPLGADRMGFVWLDGRLTVDAGGDPLPHGGGGARMSLYFTSLDASGGRGDEVALDDRVCDCCQTAAASAAQTLLVAYRDRSPDEVRDTAVVRRSDGAWSVPVSVSTEGWRIDGCPVNGPALDADRSGRAALAWFSAPDEKPVVKLAFSDDAGASWSAGVRIDEGRPLGRLDVVLLPDGAALVSWLEQAEGGAELRLRRATRSGGAGPSRVVASTRAARSSGFPRLLVAGDELLAAWRDADEPGRLRTAVARLP